MKTRRQLRRIITEQRTRLDTQRTRIRELEEALATLEWQLVYGGDQR